MLQPLPPIQNLVNVLSHYRLYVRQVLVELGGVLGGGGIDEVLPPPLNDEVEFDEGVRTGGGVDGVPPSGVAVVVSQGFQEGVDDFVKVEECEAFGVGFFGEG